MNDDLIATDHPLTPSQQRTLSALLDTLLPASVDGRMPSAGEMDFTGYLGEQREVFVPVLLKMLCSFDEAFADLSLSERCTIVEAFSQTQPQSFQGFLFHAYACYYENDRVLEGIGLAAGPPFPRGNTIEAGDLSLLDPVMKGSQTYRK
jgi:hypothetical protein